MKWKARKLWIAAVIIASVTLLSPMKAEEPIIHNAESVYQNMESSVFYIRNFRNEDVLQSVGTGVILSQTGLAATAYHVVKEAAVLEVILADGDVLRNVQILAYDELMDTALLQLPLAVQQSPYPVLPLRSEAVSHGERIFAIGYPLRDTPIITEGIINSPQAAINGRHRILISAQIASGMSGGPVLDNRGRLIGIISGSLRTIQGIHLVAGAEQLESLIEGIEP